MNFAVLSCIYGQRNDLTEEEYRAIKFNGFDISSIRNTKGVEHELKQLFDFNYIINQDDDEKSIYYSSSPLNVLFQDGFLVNGKVSNWQLTNFIIESDEIEVELKKLTFKVGDNISVLGFVNQLKFRDGIFRISFVIGSEALIVNFNQVTKVITKIEYVYYNT